MFGEEKNKKAMKIWETVFESINVNKYLSPIYTLFHSAKEAIQFIVENGILGRLKKSSNSDEEEKVIKYFRQFIHSAQVDIRGIVKKHLSFSNMFSIFGFSDEEEKLFSTSMGNVEQKFENYGSKNFSLNFNFDSDEKRKKNLVASTFEILLDFQKFEQLKVKLLS